MFKEKEEEEEEPPQLPPPAHIDAISAGGFPNSERNVDSFSNMFSDCGFMVNDGSKRLSILSTRSNRSKAQDRWSFLSFQHEDLELANFGNRNSAFVRLPDIPEPDRDLESPTTLVEDEDGIPKYQEGSQLARLPIVEGTKLWMLVGV